MEHTPGSRDINEGSRKEIDMGCQCSLSYRDAKRPCRKCLLAEVERLKAVKHPYCVACISVLNENKHLRGALEKALRVLKKCSYSEATVIVGDALDLEAPKEGRAIEICPLHEAAPDLLETCKLLVRDNPSTLTLGEWYERLTQARAAIAKAEGK